MKLCLKVISTVVIHSINPPVDQGTCPALSGDDILHIFKICLLEFSCYSRVRFKTSCRPKP